MMLSFSKFCTRSYNNAININFLNLVNCIRFSLFDIHFSEVSSFFVICYSTFIFQKLVRFSLFVIRHSFFRSKFVFRYSLFDIRTLTFFQVIMLINLV